MIYIIDYVPNLNIYSSFFLPFRCFNFFLFFFLLILVSNNNVLIFL